MPIFERSAVQVGGVGADRLAVHDDVALLERLEPVHALDERRFARARGPAHHDHLAFLDLRACSSLSTWKVPYHLLTFLNSIIGMAARSSYSKLCGRIQRTIAILLCSRLTSRRQRERDDEVHHRDEQVHLDQPPVALRDLGRRAEEVGDREHVDERRVLEQDDGLGEQHGQHVAERLRQHDLRHGLPVSETERIAGRDLAARHALDAGAHDLGVVRGLEHREGDDRRPERADLYRLLRADRPRRRCRARGSRTRRSPAPAAPSASGSRTCRRAC